jgi:hypothetical protein
VRPIARSTNRLFSSPPEDAVHAISGIAMTMTVNAMGAASLTFALALDGLTAMRSPTVNRVKTRTATIVVVPIPSAPSSSLPSREESRRPYP